MWLAEKGGDLYHHPYDLGVYENLISVRTIPTTSLLFCREQCSAYQLTINAK
jgi:hypothetical protein